MNKFKKFINLIFILGFAVSLSACGKRNVEPISKTQLWLDTPCEITIYDETSTKSLDKGFEAIKNIHYKMNANAENSEISKINKNAGLDYVKVSDETFYVIKEAKKYNNITHGKFDITVGPLVKLWGINTDHARIPSQNEIKEKLSLINSNDVLLDEKEKKVKLKNKGMSIDLGGIAKGYAADAVAKALKESNVEHAIINLGGNVLAMGSKPDKTDWKIGVQNPNSNRGNYLGIVKASNKSVVTSGIYERFFEKNGKIYHHIFDTSTGYPVDNSLSSVTIVTNVSTNGDALAKAFCMGLDEGLEFIKGIKGVDAIFVTKDNKVYITPGLKNKFELTDSNFKLMN